MPAFGGYLRENGLATLVRWNTCHINPPLIINEEQLREGLAIIDRGLEIVDKAVA
jgi:taurine--2-oxoglutarate transaminase